MTTKTPVTLLQEYCQQQKCSQPDYIELPPKFVNTVLQFYCSVSLRGQDSVGFGKNKKAAKQNAASNLLDILNRNGFQSDQINQNVELLNQVGCLMEKCAQNKWPMPFFEELERNGASHMPIFSYRCTLFKIIREAQAQSKKQAKNHVAGLVLEAAKDLHDEQKQEVEWGMIDITKAFDEQLQIDDLILKAYTTHIEKRRKIPPPKYKRNDFFSTLDPNLIKKAYKLFISSSHLPMEYRVLLLLKNLKINNYKIEIAPSKGEPMKGFSIKEADLYFVEVQKNFWPKLADFFNVMLEFKIDSNEFNSLKEI